jgi:multidrug efflux system membrane fusion protein
VKISWLFSINALRLLLIVPIFFSACSSEKSGNPQKNVSFPVILGTVTQKTVPVQLRTIGNVQAYSTVIVKSQIGGELVRVHFTEGQDVKRGDLLFTIDPRPYEAALKQAQANLERDIAQVKQAEANLAKSNAQVKQAEADLARDIANAKNAEVEARRYEFLIEKGVVARQQYDKFRTDADALEATVRADRAALENAEASVRASHAALENAEASVHASRAALENAKVQLGYCFIRSPMNGRTGSLMVQQGSVIKANDIDIVVINQITPTYVSFSVPEQYLSEIKKYMAKEKLKVEAIVPKETGRPEEGFITFIDNTVDKATGTIQLKGTFGNKERNLWPGQFVNVVLTLTTQPNVVVAPSQAIQTGQQGQYVFVVKPDLTVESRPVVVGRIVDGETVIEKGLEAGERVVTDGQLRLYPGARVEIKTSELTGTLKEKVQ